MRQGTKPEDPMSANIRDLVIEYNHAFGDGRLDRVAEMLHPDVVFDGTVGKDGSSARATLRLVR